MCDISCLFDFFPVHCRVTANCDRFGVYLGSKSTGLFLSLSHMHPYKGLTPYRCCCFLHLKGSASVSHSSLEAHLATSRDMM